MNVYLISVLLILLGKYILDVVVERLNIKNLNPEQCLSHVQVLHVHKHPALKPSNDVSEPECIYAELRSSSDTT